MVKWASSIAAAIALCIASHGNTVDPRFTDHGVIAPVSLARGAAATLDGDGRRVLLIWQTDIGQLLAINIEDGSTKQFSMPDFPKGGNSFGVLQSKDGKWYTGAAPFGKPGMVYEFDPETMAFTNTFKSPSTYAMAFHEDADGFIWIVFYPDSRLMRYHPKTGEVVDFGSLNSENWPQYPRGGVARDQSGWVYTVIGFTRCQILGFNPETREIRRFIPENERGTGSDGPGRIGESFLGEDGAVYARTVTTEGMTWFKLYNGEAARLSQEPAVARITERTSSAWGNFFDFPDGSRITHLDVPYKRLTVKDRDGAERRMTFDYEAPGAQARTVFAGPNGDIFGSTYAPRFVYRFDAESGKFFLHPETHAGGAWQSWVVRGDKIYGAFYPWGMIREIDSTRPWTRSADVEFDKADYGKSVQADPHIYRPFVLISHIDGEHMIMGGKPGYGLTGGGLMIWNPVTDKSEILTHTDLLEHQSTIALAALANGDLVGVTTVAPGYGGERLAQDAEIYLFDWKERKIIWHQPLPPTADKNIESYDMLTAGNGLVYLLDGGNTAVHIFDPAKRAITQTIDLKQYGNVVNSSYNGFMIKGDNGELYLLFERAIVKLNSHNNTHSKLVDLPVTPFGALALSRGRIYFLSGSNLWSYKLR